MVVSVCQSRTFLNIFSDGLGGEVSPLTQCVVSCGYIVCGITQEVGFRSCLPHIGLGLLVQCLVRVPVTALLEVPEGRVLDRHTQNKSIDDCPQYDQGWLVGSRRDKQGGIRGPSRFPRANMLRFAK